MMETFLGLLMMAALAGIPIGLFSAIVKKIRGKPAKKSLMAAGISMAVFIAAVCAFPTDQKERQDEEEYSAAVERMDGKSVKSDDDPSVAETDADQHEDAEYIDSNIRLENYLYGNNDFSEERVFVQFKDHSEVTEDDINDAVKAFTGDDKDKANYLKQNWDELNAFQGYNRAALIDTHGKILWKSEYTKNSDVLLERSEFKDGVAYCIFNGNDKKSYYIIDSDGNATFTRDVDENYVILGHGGGSFLVAEHMVNFDADEWKLGAIDKNGNIVVPFKTYLMGTPPSVSETVAAPTDISAELQEIQDALDQIDMEYQAWLEKCWDYDGPTNDEYYEMIRETEDEFSERRRKLNEYRFQLEQQYSEQDKAYQDYQQELDEYDRRNGSREELSFDSIWGSFSEYRCEYRGKGIFELECLDNPNGNEWRVLINVDTQKVIYTWDSYSKKISAFLSDFENGAASVLCDDEADGMFICRMDTDGAMKEPVSNDLIRYCLGYDTEFGDGLVFVPDQNDDLVFVPGQNDGGWIDAGAYYNAAGEKAIDFPEYRGKNSYYGCAFHNGYAVLFLEGADKQRYITVIDKKGEKMFEPIPGYEKASVSEDGKYLTAVRSGFLSIFDINGKELVSVDSKSIHMSDKSDYYVYDYNVYDGVIRIDDFYVNIEDKTIIGAHEKYYDPDFSLVFH